MEDRVGRGRGVLLLADGSRFEGELFGAAAIGEGELVFTTGMTGFQESLTDPSFAGQVLTFTWPLLGNYGIAAGV
ncbi:MAG TPA: carbamoyl phosphate synthase small subunit, partial [Candidatus Thalassarchaeaceae archaeon]